MFGYFQHGFYRRLRMGYNSFIGFIGKIALNSIIKHASDSMKEERETTEKEHKKNLDGSIDAEFKVIEQ